MTRGKARYVEGCLLLLINRNRLITSTRAMDRVGDWTIKQVEWLDDQTELYLASVQDDDLSFFSTVCEQFLSLWPVRETLWPSKPEYQHLTKPELRCVYRGEDLLKSVRFIRSIFVFARPSLTLLNFSASERSSRIGTHKQGRVYSPRALECGLTTSGNGLRPTSHYTSLLVATTNFISSGRLCSRTFLECGPFVSSYGLRSPPGRS